jgi:hypothetical protein
LLRACGGVIGPSEEGEEGGSAGSAAAASNAAGRLAGGLRFNTPTEFACTIATASLPKGSNANRARNRHQGQFQSRKRSSLCIGIGILAAFADFSAENVNVVKTRAGFSLGKLPMFQKQMLPRITLSLLVTTLSMNAFAIAQDAPATAPTSAPARHAITIPPGFTKVEAEGHTVICEPADEVWVRPVLGAINPRALPTTMPADMLEHANAHRQEITKQMMADLNIDQPTAAEFFDQTLIPQLTKLRDFKAPIFFLVTTHDRLKEILRSGWTDPNFYYNRAADDIMTNAETVGLNTESMDDKVIANLYGKEDDTPAKAGRLAGALVDIDANLAAALSSRGAGMVRALFETFIGTKVIKPLDLKMDQAWLGMGIGGICSSRYAAPVLGIEPKTIIEAMTYEDRRTYLKVSAVDLLHPADPATLLPQAAPLYLSTAHRKSMMAIVALLKQAGDDTVIPKILDAVKQNKPADGPALVKLIADVTKVDLTKNLSD